MNDLNKLNWFSPKMSPLWTLVRPGPLLSSYLHKGHITSCTGTECRYSICGNQLRRTPCFHVSIQSYFWCFVSLSLDIKQYVNSSSTLFCSVQTTLLVPGGQFSSSSSGVKKNSNNNHGITTSSRRQTGVQYADQYMSPGAKALRPLSHNCVEWHN